MGIVLISILCLIVFAAGWVVSLSYAIYLWEKNVVTNLAGQIEPITENSIFKPQSKKHFTPEVSSAAFDKMNKNGAVKMVSGAYENTLMKIKENDYQGILKKTWHIISDFFANFSTRMKQLFDYLVTLSKPIATDVTLDDGVKAKEDEIIDNTIEKVVAQNEEKETVPDSDVASVVTSTKTKKEEDLEMFERLEGRILAKLKESGLNNYDLWLQLGDLYIKYDEQEKAKEIFAMILKSSEGQYKELARDRLIGLD
jgi:hypothetical protein